MDIIQLEGEDRRLYDLVAHLVMSEKVLNYNLNYPYKTAPEYRWFVAVDNGNVLGFIPVKREEGKVRINNYYVVDDDCLVFSALLKEILRAFPDNELESVTQLRHVPEFERNGFSIVLYWKRYAKMRAFKDGKERL